MRPGVRLRRADSRPGLQSAGSDRLPSQSFLSGGQWPLIRHQPRGAHLVPKEPNRGGPVHEQGDRSRRARPVCHGPSGRGKLCQVSERGSAGDR